MKTKITLGLLSLILFVTLGAVPQQQPQPTLWEYKLEYGSVTPKKANELGAQGWELAAIESTSSAPGANVPVYVFKRGR